MLRVVFAASCLRLSVRLNAAFPMKILAVEFSSLQRSVAVLAGRSASEVVQTGADALDALQMADTALRDAAIERAQIGMIVVGLGPGSYNGIRAAIALARGWQMARPVKVCGMSSVECVAEQARDQGFRGSVAVAVDAQRDEFYLGRYEISAQYCEVVAPLQVLGLDEILRIQASGATIIGPHVADRIPNARNFFPRAATLGKLGMLLGEAIACSRLEPIYLRETSFVKTTLVRKIPSA